LSELSVVSHVLSASAGLTWITLGTPVLAVKRLVTLELVTVGTEFRVGLKSTFI